MDPQPELEAPRLATIDIMDPETVKLSNIENVTSEKTKEHSASTEDFPSMTELLTSLPKEVSSVEQTHLQKNTTSIEQTTLPKDTSSIEQANAPKETSSVEKAQSIPDHPATAEPSLPKTVFLHHLPIPQYSPFTDPRRAHAEPDGSMRFGFHPSISVSDPKSRLFKSAKPPHKLFNVSLSLCTSTAYRFISRKCNTEMLLFCAGTALDNGSDDLGRDRGGCAVVLTAKQKGDPVLFSLEDNNEAKHTLNRAELRAAVGSLRLRWWPGEGFKHVVVGTSSKYVVDNIIAGNVEAWKKEDWDVSGEDGVKQKVENWDLWKEMGDVFQSWDTQGVKVSFWLLPEEWNEAKSYAKKAAMANKSRFQRSFEEPRLCTCERGGYKRKQHWLTEPCHKFLLAPMKSVSFRKPQE